MLLPFSILTTAHRQALTPTSNRALVHRHAAVYRRHAAVVLQQQDTSPLDSILTSAKKLSEALSEGRGWKQGVAEAMAGEYDPETIVQPLSEIVVSAPVVIFQWPTSPACQKAVKLLRLAGVEPKTVDLEFDAIGNARRAELGRMTGRSSVPSIWIGGQYVGGCDDGPTEAAPGLVEMSFAGTLRERLDAALGATVPALAEVEASPEAEAIASTFKSAAERARVMAAYSKDMKAGRMKVVAAAANPNGSAAPLLVRATIEPEAATAPELAPAAEPVAAEPTAAAAPVAPEPAAVEGKVASTDAGVPTGFIDAGIF